MIRAISLILLGFGIPQLGMSFKNHDLSQRANGMMAIVSGIDVTFTKDILLYHWMIRATARGNLNSALGTWNDKLAEI